MIPSVLCVAAEAFPLAKTGGLGDVVGGLVGALQAQAVDVTVVMPGYPRAVAAVQALQSIGQLRLPFDLSTAPVARLLCGRFPDSTVKVVLVHCPALYDRNDGLYTDNCGRDYTDNPQRFAALCHAATAIAAGRTALPIPDLVHAHDWHAALTPLLLQAAGVTVPSVFTVHNLAFQGLCPLTLAPMLGLPDYCLGSDGIEFWGQLNFMKAGIRYADRITTVSRAYLEEILTPRFGHGLDGLLRARRGVLSAIPNGVDTEVWNPATDTMLPRTYSTSTMMIGKRTCKTELQKRLGLPANPQVPLVALGSRLTHQKMADVALGAIEAVVTEPGNVQFAVLGCGEPRFEQAFTELALRWPNRVAAAIGYSEGDAHLLHAGADILLHGSRFEPFGLTPVYAMRYGTVPIVSRVGGLIDTVRDACSAHGNEADNGQVRPGATGFLFDGESVSDMSAALQRALQCFSRLRMWRALQRTGMRQPCSWDEPAAQYLALYGTLKPQMAAAIAPPIPAIHTLGHRMPSHQIPRPAQPDTKDASTAPGNPLGGPALA